MQSGAPAHQDNSELITLLCTKFRCFTQRNFNLQHACL